MIQIAEVAPPAPVAPVTPSHLIAMAVQSGANVDQLERLMAMQIQWDQHQLVLAKVDAEKAFNVAMSAFKLDPPVIAKDKHVHFDGQKGATDYDHATHFGVTTAIAKALARHDLSHGWKTEQADGKITVICTLKHKLGHSESTSMSAAYDASGGKNAIQAIGSAKTYLERYTLLGITGLSTQDLPDDDGASASPQVIEGVLQGLLAQVEKAADDKTCVTLWNSGKATLIAMGDQAAHDEFKLAVAARRTALKGAK